MRWVNFTIVNIQQTGPQQFTVQKKANVPVNPGAVQMVVPATIPTDIAGPNGAPMGKPAAALNFSSGAVLVDCSVKEALWKLTNESVEIEKPEENEEEDTPNRPTLKLYKGD